VADEAARSEADSSAAVRRATAADAAAIGALLFRYNSEYEEETPAAEVLAHHLGALLGDGEIIVMLVGDGPDGFCQFRFKRSYYDGRPDAHVEELYVVPDRRGQGLGRALLDATIAACRAAGATHIELTTSEDDTEARGLYESSGFTNREGSPEGPRMLYYEREL
jgi:ribosomal protein S18 acetylase RimI-like enzyme